MKKLWELFIGLSLLAGIGVAIALLVREGWVSGLVFVVFWLGFLGLVSVVVEKIGNLLSKIFSPPR